jgi:hypothetical protein
MFKLFPRCLAGAFAICLSLTLSAAALGDWQKIGDGKLRSISGMVVLAAGPPRESSEDRQELELLVVHDSKKPGETRLAVVAIAGEQIEYRPLQWPADAPAPQDLEAISAVPGAPGEFAVLASEGKVVWLTLADQCVNVVATTTLPEIPSGANFEGLSVQSVGGQCVIAWGHRGAGVDRGVLFWGLLDPQTKAISAVGKAAIEVPSPPPTDANTRHIAELKLDANGVVWAAAASDPGDDGPYTSVVYTLGVLHTDEREVRFDANRDLTCLWTFERKIEALELIGGARGGILFGTDDENAGGWIRCR